MRTHLKDGLSYSRVKGTILIKRELLDGYLESFRVEESNQFDKLVDEILESLRRQCIQRTAFRLEICLEFDFQATKKRLADVGYSVGNANTGR